MLVNHVRALIEQANKALTAAAVEKIESKCKLCLDTKVCPNCEGTGLETELGIDPCPDCDGTRKCSCTLPDTAGVGEDFGCDICGYTKICTECEGTGKEEDGEPCTECEGTGKCACTITYHVKIEHPEK